VSHAGKTTSLGSTTGTLIFANRHLRGPLALVFAPNGNLPTANGDAVNGDPTHPSEIVEFTKSGEFVREFNVDAGQGGAFGIATVLSPVTHPSTLRRSATCPIPYRSIPCRECGA